LGRASDGENAASVNARSPLILLMAIEILETSQRLEHVAQRPDHQCC